MRKTLLSVPLVVGVAAGSIACVTRGYVNQGIAEVNEKVETLSEALEETQEQTRKNAEGVAEAQGQAQAAGQSADAAGRSAAEAGSAAAGRGLPRRSHHRQAALRGDGGRDPPDPAGGGRAVPADGPVDLHGAGRARMG